MGKLVTETGDLYKGFRICLGTFNIVEEAAGAYAEVAERICCNKAKLNFAHPLPPITPPPVKKRCMRFPELNRLSFEDCFFYFFIFFEREDYFFTDLWISLGYAFEFINNWFSVKALLILKIYNSIENVILSY
ncbi:hypothetical protein WN943_022995 [Citrus x changshan-huyou]